MLDFPAMLLCFRPLSEEEKRAKTPVAISCNEQRREVSVIQNVTNKHTDKAFVFDNVSSWFFVFVLVETYVKLLCSYQ